MKTRSEKKSLIPTEYLFWDLLPIFPVFYVFRALDSWLGSFTLSLIEGTKNSCWRGAKILLWHTTDYLVVCSWLIDEWNQNRSKTISCCTVPQQYGTVRVLYGTGAVRYGCCTVKNSIICCNAPKIKSVRTRIKQLRHSYQILCFGRMKRERETLGRKRNRSTTKEFFSSLLRRRLLPRIACVMWSVSSWNRVAFQARQAAIDCEPNE